MDDFERCGNEFNSLLEWLRQHIKGGGGGGGDGDPVIGPVMREVTEVINGLNQMMFATVIKDRELASAVRKQASQQVARAAQNLGQLGFPSDEPGSPVGPRTRGQAARG